MGEFNVLTTMCAVLALTLPAARARKYDVDAEALRLYGEDLASVLRKFRRSTDYMLLLQQKYAELLALFNDVFSHVYTRVLRGPLRDRLANLFGLNLQPAASVRARPARGRRDAGEAGAGATRSPVEQLDEYVHERGELSTPERNRVRDVAFEVTGRAIHMIVNGMGPADVGALSTRLAFGGAGDAVPLTQRDHHHTIATAGPLVASADSRPPAPHPQPQSPIDETLRAYALRQT